MIREPLADDLDYFIDVGKQYAEENGLDFDEGIYLGSLMEIAQNQNVKIYVIPGQSHCIMRLFQSTYGKDVIARVLSTAGKGGIQCFRKARRWAIRRGATKIIADANKEPRIDKFYRRIGMHKQDTNYIGDL